MMPEQVKQPQPPPQIVKPKVQPVKPPPVQRNLHPESADERFPLVLLDIHRNINGVLTVQLWERSTGKIHKAGSFDAIGGYILTKIDFDESSVVIADSKAEMKLYLLRKTAPAP
jgi:hypothetical protein